MVSFLLILLLIYGLVRVADPAVGHLQKFIWGTIAVFSLVVLAIFIYIFLHLYMF